MLWKTIGATALLSLAMAAAAAEEVKGPVTGLPLPRYVSLKASKANVRRGPGLTHRVDWVFLRRGMPLQVIAEYGHWRKVRDMDDATGWVHYSLLSGARTAIVTAARAALHEDRAVESRIVAYAEQGVVVDVDACEAFWCEVEANGHDGWAPKTDFWGVDPNEEFD